jgi:DtxR family Mn-dependent transcriptional regulator
MSFSVTEENYIKAIFHLQQEDDTVSTNELAAVLHTRPASVTDMLKKLKTKKLLSYERYKGVRLSAEGKSLPWPSYGSTGSGNIFCSIPCSSAGMKCTK